MNPISSEHNMDNDANRE